MLAKKLFVVDTNVVISDPNFISKLRGDVLIPTTVLKELDKHKYGNSEKSKNIREFARLLEKKYDKFKFFKSHSFAGEPDEQIIEVAKSLKESGEEVVLLTNDILMGIMAKTYGINVQKHDRRYRAIDKSYHGILHYKNGKRVRKAKYPNEYLVREDGLYKLNSKGNLDRLGKDKKVWGIRHRNVEQKCALDALLDDDIKLVTLSGKAGTGKTLLAIASGLEKVAIENKYKKLLVSRPVVPMGHDIGYLPGDIEEKLSPWMQPIFDNIDYLFSASSRGMVPNDRWRELERQGLLRLEALTYIRGRSIPNQFIIIDEAQNLTKHEVKTIISRAGEGSKIILTGDPNQIDNPKLDSSNNGLSYVIDKFKSQSIAAHITLSKCERSDLADIAAEIL